MGLLLSLQNNIFSKLANSKKFNEYEKDTVIILLKEFFANYLENGNGSYLNELNLDKINFLWDFNGGKQVLLSPDNCSLGMFSPFCFNSIFVTPFFSVQCFYEYILNSDIIKNPTNTSIDNDYKNINDEIKYYNSDTFYVNENIDAINNGKKILRIISAIGTPFINKIWCKDFFKFKTLAFFCRI